MDYLAIFAKGGSLDFRPKKKEWREAIEGAPPL